MRRVLLNLVMALALVMPILAQPSLVFACAKGDAATVLKAVNQGGNCNDSAVNNTVADIVSLLSLFVGIIAVIIIIIAGLKYITSNGDSNKVGNAKSTLLYALIGLAIAALAEALVRFVLFHANKAAGS